MLAHLYTSHPHTTKSRYVARQTTDRNSTSDLTPIRPVATVATLQGDDSTAEKITGSVVNAVIFVAVIALMTCVLFLLFKYGNDANLKNLC